MNPYSSKIYELVDLAEGDEDIEDILMQEELQARGQVLAATRALQWKHTLEQLCWQGRKQGQSGIFGLQQAIFDLH